MKLNFQREKTPTPYIFKVFEKLDNTKEMLQMVNWKKRRKEIDKQLEKWCDDFIHQGYNRFIDLMIEQEQQILKDFVHDVLYQSEDLDDAINKLEVVKNEITET